MSLRTVVILAFLYALGCSSTLPLGSNDGGGSMSGGDAGSGPGSSGPTSLPKCFGNGSAFACSGGDGSVDPSACQSDCETAAAACNVGSFTAEADCSTLCLQGTSCSALVSALNGHGTLCGFANAGGGSVDPSCCAQVCEYAATVGCNVGGSTADSECVSLCASSPNRTQLSCVLAVPCTMLVGALGDQGKICGIGE
jgi:hypothetical protein